MNYPAPFSENQNTFFWRCFDNWLNVAEGGKRGGKNVLITMAYCSILEKHPSKLHLIAGVSTTTARLNILDCDGYGMTNFFEGRCREGQYKNRDCLYINTPAGEKIVLVSGGGKDRDERLIKGNTYGTAYITEANECHPNFIKEVFDRTISSPDRKVFHDLNPKAPSHWYYEDVIGFHEKQQLADPGYGYNYGHFDISDNMSISDDQLRKILKTYDKSSVWYKRDILGERCIAEGLVYPGFNEGCIFDELPWQAKQRGRWYISIDYGTVNAFSAGLWCVYKGVGYRCREYYYDSRKTHNRVDNEIYYREIENLAGDVVVDRIVIDPSAAAFKETIRKYGKFACWDADNSVIEGIRVTTELLNAGKFKVHRSCKDFIAEINAYSWDMEAPEDAVMKEKDHAMDDTRYFCMSVLRKES